VLRGDKSYSLFAMALITPLRRRRELERLPIMEFEVAQLGNLCPEDADEAKSLVPSVALPNLDGEPRSIDSAALTEVLQQICDCRQFD